ncbi:MAG: HAD hydrolase-like protein [Candidatus Marsarchaeota archaeon]|jgi:phosphoglycolate phosphatase-like HAD superfamily hydrolase|nr:HAD hydrolase-like protein [Candidatus Marsarchaeota archaeon]MCL5115125.1 HAD hydrolase-like protein [Candidatus Marsarchaeota archaeon]
MAERLVLIDINGVLVKDSRDVSEYVAEAIRSRYGLEAHFNLSDYEGASAQDMLRDILAKNGVSDDEINARLQGCAEELGYSYYNVTGREAIVVLDGAKQLLGELVKKGILVGIATGDIEDIVKNKLERAGLSDYFKFGEYGNREASLEKIIRNAVERAKKEFDFSGQSVWILSSTPRMLSAAKAAGVNALGVESGQHDSSELSAAGAAEVVKGVKERSNIIKAVLG